MLVSTALATTTEAPWSKRSRLPMVSFVAHTAMLTQTALSRMSTTLLMLLGSVSVQPTSLFTMLMPQSKLLLLFMLLHHLSLPLKSAMPTCPMPPTMATQSQLLLLPQLPLLSLLLRPLLTQQTPSITPKMTSASTTTDTATPTLSSLRWPTPTCHTPRTTDMLHLLPPKSLFVGSQA